MTIDAETGPVGTSPELESFVGKSVHPMFIAAELTQTAAEASIDASSPSDGRALGTIGCAGATDVDRAVTAARSALAGPWSAMLPAERERHLRRVAELIERDGPTLAAIESIDNGKPIAKTRATDSGVAARLAYAFAGWPTKIAGETPSVSSPGFFTYTRREPLGVVGAIIPWNYPLIHTAQKIMPALACGNTVVLKPSEKASLVTLRMAELFAEADLPPGVVNIVTGDGSTGALMSAHPGVDKLAFTGSVASGQAVMRAAADTTKRLSLELGNKGANIVFADADLDVAIPRSFGAAFGNTGQSCVAGSRLFVEAEIADEVVDQLAGLAANVRIGHALDPDTALGPIVDRIQLESILGHVDRGVAEGAVVRCGGRQMTEGPFADGYFVEPTIFDDVDDTMEIARTEIFGPVLTVHPFTSEDEVITRANDTPYGLAAAVWTGSAARAHRMAAKLDTGVVWVNTFDMFDPAMPFGGHKRSGFGRDNGRDVIDMYTESKAVWVATG
jgi:acyl-CoA reductase-like NAD-dependent aldehyde dehydrogenase